MTLTLHTRSLQGSSELSTIYSGAIVNLGALYTSWTELKDLHAPGTVVSPAAATPSLKISYIWRIGQR
jgi:hypothetical protein